MRFIVASCALLSLCSAARAVPINITDISGTWIAQDDALELRFEFDRPPVLTNDFISFVGFTSLDYPYESVNILNSPLPAESMRSISIYTRIVGSGHQAEEVNTIIAPWHVVDHAIDGNSMTVMLSVPELNLMGNELHANAFTAEWSNMSVHGARWDGLVLLHAPEPSSVAIAAIGVMGLIVHRLRRWRPRADGGAGLGGCGDHRG